MEKKNTPKTGNQTARRLYHGKYPIGEAEYVIEPIYNGPSLEYWQLVRVKDDAILHAYKSRNDVYLAAWQGGIPYSKTTVI